MSVGNACLVLLWKKEMEDNMSQVLFYIFFGIMAVIGGGSSLFIVASMPAVFVWKVSQSRRDYYACDVCC